MVSDASALRTYTGPVSRIQQWCVGAGMSVMLARCAAGVESLRSARWACALDISSGLVCRRTGSKAAIVVARLIISFLVLRCSSGKVEGGEGKLRSVAMCGVVSDGQIYLLSISSASWCLICQILLVGGMVENKMPSER